jgi:hypothetical protein
MLLAPKIIATKAVMVLAVGLGCAASTLATPTTWTFTGVIQSGYADAGQTVSGSLTVDLSTLALLFLAPTVAQYDGNYFPPYPNPTQTFGSISDGTIGATVGGGTYQDLAFVVLEKNDSINPAQNVFRDSFAVGGASYQLFGGGGIRSGELQLVTYMDTDGVNPSGIFSNRTYANPDLSAQQSVNWFSVGSHNIGEFSSLNQDSVLFDLTSLTVTGGSQSVPEPGSLPLAAAALVALVAAGRRSNA